MRFDKVEWLFFDMGSTLVDERAAYKEWFARAAALTAGVLSADDIEREYCAGMARYAATVRGQLQTVGVDDSTVHLFPPELETPYPEAAGVLARLATRYRLGVIANQGPGAAERLHAYGLDDHLEVIVCSADVGVRKPDPRIFELALSRAGCAPGQAAMIGDRPDNDICPAKRLGMATVRVRRGYAVYQVPRSEEYEADATVDRLADVPGLFGV